MAIPVLKLNLAPEPSLWRQNHEALGWGALGLGALLLAGTAAYTGWKYVNATREARRNVSLGAEARKLASEQSRLVETLKGIDVSTELPRWKLAERILSERSLPWSRLTAELERSLVQDVRIKSIQRSRAADQSVQLALKGEARSRDAEAKFIERLQGNKVFAQVLLEREAERQGGGLDFELKLPASATPTPYEPLPEPEYGPGTAPAPRPAPAPAATRAAAPASPAETAAGQRPDPAGGRAAGAAGRAPGAAGRSALPDASDPEQRLEALRTRQRQLLESGRAQRPDGGRPSGFEGAGRSGRGSRREAP